jgi:hypothetical protein
MYPLKALVGYGGLFRLGLFAIVFFPPNPPYRYRDLGVFELDLNSLEFVVCPWLMIM